MVEYWLFLATAALMAGLAVWVLAVRPRDRTNQVLAAFLILLAGAALAFQAFRETRTGLEGAAYFRLIAWYEIPAVALLGWFLDELFLPQPRPRWRKALLGAWLAGNAALLLGLVLTPELYIGDPLRPNNTTGPLSGAHQASFFLVDLVAVVLAARAARNPAASLLQRRQAALVGLAFGFLVGHAAVGAVGGFARLPELTTQSQAMAVYVVSLLGLPVIILAAPTLVRAFEGRRARLLAAACIAVPMVAAGWEAMSVLASVPLIWPGGTRPFWLAAFAATLALATVRYGLAGVVPDAKSRLGPAAASAIALTGAGVGAYVAVSFLGYTLQAVLVGLGALALALLLLRSPAAGFAGALAGRVTLDAANPDVGAERVRIYLAALRASRAGAQGPSDEAQRVLRRLRGELGLTSRDHQVLAALAEQAAAPGEATDRLLFGRYLLEQPLGRGGSARVWLARDIVIGRAVVIKELERPGRGAERLLAEMRTLGRINHPRVLTLFHAEQVGGQVFLVLEHAPGGSLSDLLAKSGALPEAEALALTLDVLEALEAVHGAGLVHGDVKGANVLLGADGRAKLADFGSTRRRASGDDHDATVPLPDQTATLSAAAPEQVRGEAPTPATDVYAAGALLYRLLAGQHYLDFDACDEAEARARILRDAPRLPHPRMASALAGVVLRALAKDPAQRYASAPELRGALLAAVGSPARPSVRASAAATSAPPPEPPGRAVVPG